MSDLHWLTASEAARAFAARTLSPVELMTALLDRIGRLDPRVNAFIRLDAEAAMTMARNAEAEIEARPRPGHRGQTVRRLKFWWVMLMRNCRPFRPPTREAGSAEVTG